MQKPSKWSVLGIVGTGVFMCTLDSSIVNVSLPAIAKHFGAPVGAEVEWVIIAYLVVIASTLLTVGRLADRIGHRPIWLSGLTVFTVAIAGAVFVGLGAAAAGRALLGHPHDPALSTTFLRGFQWALRTCAALSAAAIVTSLLRGSEGAHSASSSPRPASGPLESSRISPAT